MRMSWKKATVVAAGVVVVGLSGAGVALAETTAPAPAAPAAPRHHLGEHGEFVAHRKAGDVTVDVQRGVVTAVTPTSITLRSRDGFTQTYALDASTTIRKDKQPATVGQIALGDHVGLRAQKEPQGLRATRIHDRGATAATPGASTTPPTPAPPG